ncbi:hypothetical protein [Alkalibacterium gilvum]|uniref:hypothetical protein n=1 Tax=Alkalibacterium gilvum TaxID=1130080 RepID=UPI0015A72A5E|nr:hypothetical protein [Alkalibacterium gilvum]
MQKLVGAVNNSKSILQADEFKLYFNEMSKIDESGEYALMDPEQFRKEVNSREKV